MLILTLFALHAIIAWNRGLKAAIWAVGLGALIPWLAYAAIILMGWMADGLQSASSRWAIGAGFVMVGVVGSLSWLATGFAGSAVGLLVRRWTHRTPVTAPEDS